MKVILTEKDLEVLFKDSNCVVVSDWDGAPATINKTDDNRFYMVRWEEYDPCTKLMNGEMYGYENDEDNEEAAFDDVLKAQENTD